MSAESAIQLIKIFTEMGKNKLQSTQRQMLLGLVRTEVLKRTIVADKNQKKPTGI